MPAETAASRSAAGLVALDAPDDGAAALVTPAALADPAQRARLSIALLRVALVHLALRAPTDAPRGPLPPLADDETLSPEEFRFALTRSIAAHLGRPAHCGRRACRRGNVCRGKAPACWANEPPPSRRELDLAKQLVRFHLDAALAASGGGEES